MRDVESLSREELIDVIIDQHRLIERLQTDIEQLKKRGSAAPFSRGMRKSNPKPPGRKPGQGYFRFRKEPEQANKEAVTAVPVPPPAVRAAAERWAKFVGKSFLPPTSQPRWFPTCVSTQWK